MPVRRTVCPSCRSGLTVACLPLKVVDPSRELVNQSSDSKLGFIDADLVVIGFIDNDLLVLDRPLRPHFEATVPGRVDYFAGHTDLARCAATVTGAIAAAHRRTRVGRLGLIAQAHVVRQFRPTIVREIAMPPPQGVVFAWVCLRIGLADCGGEFWSRMNLAARLALEVASRSDINGPVNTERAPLAIWNLFVNMRKAFLGGTAVPDAGNAAFDRSAFRAMAEVDFILTELVRLVIWNEFVGIRKANLIFRTGMIDVGRAVRAAAFDRSAFRAMAEFDVRIHSIRRARFEAKVAAPSRAEALSELLGRSFNFRVQPGEVVLRQQLRDRTQRVLTSGHRDIAHLPTICLTLEPGSPFLFVALYKRRASLVQTLNFFVGLGALYGTRCRILLIVRNAGRDGERALIARVEVELLLLAVFLESFVFARIHGPAPHHHPAHCDRSRIVRPVVFHPGFELVVGVLIFRGRQTAHRLLKFLAEHGGAAGFLKEDGRQLGKKKLASGASVHKVLGFGPRQVVHVVEAFTSCERDLGPIRACAGRETRILFEADLRGFSAADRRDN